MPICKIIFRLDYKFLYQIMDAPGLVVSILSTPDEDYWQNVSFDPRSNVIHANASNDSLSKTISIDTTSISGSLEFAEGYKFETLFSDNDFKLLNDFTGKICSEFKIKELKRAGIRMHYFGKVSNESIKSTFKSKLDSKVREQAKS